MARYKDLCLDTGDQAASIAFWGPALGLTHDPRSVGEPQPLFGSTDQDTLWVNLVGEPKRHKARMHLDVHVNAVADLVALGATVIDDSHAWTLLRAPDGLELCAFVRDEVPQRRLYELVVDCSDPEAQARWWAAGLDLDVGSEDGTPWWWVEGDALPFDGIVFVPVPEPKAVKNRLHFDVSGIVKEFLGHGATIIDAPTNDHSWAVLADPEGNEFCVFDEE